MIIEKPAELQDTVEQIYQENTNQLSRFIFLASKKVLEKDQYGLFKLRTSQELDSKISKLDSEIERLLKMKTTLNSRLEKLQTNNKIVKTKNKKIIEVLSNKLGVVS